MQFCYRIIEAIGKGPRPGPQHRPASSVAGGRVAIQDARPAGRPRSLDGWRDGQAASHPGGPAGGSASQQGRQGSRPAAQLAKQPGRSAGQPCISACQAASDAS